MVDALVPPVGVAVFGAGTPFAYWGFDAVRECVRALFGETLHLHLTSLDALRSGITARADGSIVVTTDLPDPDLARFLCESDLPIIIFTDRVDTMIDWIARSRHCSIARSTLFNSQVFAALSPALLAPNALIIQPQTEPRDIVGAIVSHLAPAAGAERSTQLFQELTQGGRLRADGPLDWRADPAPEPHPEYGLSPSRDALDAMRKSLATYSDLFIGRLPERIVWPLPLFYCPGAKHWREPIDLTGPARIIIYGPYLHLPAGKWIARVEFEIDGAISGVEASTDVVISKVLVEKIFIMPTKGIFAFELAFAVSDPRDPIEIRLFTKRSAIEGLLLMRSVVVRAA
jgi:hypothetical protein